MTLQEMTAKQETQDSNATREMSSNAEEHVSTGAAANCELFEGGLGI